ncbi:VOC family protein [Azospirillum brasilense]|uniref:VOC family protein n=1 Tax=Azospirillum brasilense TaxID=192 RepID=UPI001ED9F244|nr:VOC family protein [Azospirillum brasilense]UKJ76053.1 VOC family protein [Azospirillum brasilense]
MKRSPLPILFLVGFVVLLSAAAVRGQTVRAVDSVGITVSDMDRALAFYRDVLTFEPVADTEVAGDAYERLTGVFGARIRIVRLRLGSEAIELIQYLAPEGRPIPVDSRSNDRWFQHIAIITGDMDAAYARLRAAKVRHASTGPQTLPAWNPNAGGIRAFYFKDPDGNPLEILQFPPGKGNPRWQGADGRLFLGIDHTAIVVADTDASLALYRDRLGLRVAGTSENYGTEQEHLNNVFGARLRITTLRAPSGPGIEFLEYLAPRDGRPAPADTRANDLWHEQVTLLTDDDPGPAAVLLPDPALGLARAVMAHDPDGHAYILGNPLGNSRHTELSHE